MNHALVVLTALGSLAAGGIAMAQQPPASRPVPTFTATTTTVPVLATVPAGSLTVTDWYKQNVYDATNAKIGDISDVLVSPSDGKITALIIGVGGFLGMGEKDIAVPFDAVQRSFGDDKARLTLNTTMEALKSAPGFKYDRKTSSWIVADVAK